MAKDSKDRKALAARSKAKEKKPSSHEITSEVQPLRKHAPGREKTEAPKPAHHIPHYGEHLHKVTVNIYSVEGDVKDKVTLPQVFNEEYRPDIIRRAVTAARANRRQTYGPSPVSGLRRSVQWSGKGKGVSRVPRLMDGMRGAQAPNTVGGRPGWGPDLRKDWSKKINDRERKKAIHSALRATREPDVVRHRGHIFKEELSLPVVVEDKAEKLATTREVIDFLSKLGIYDDVTRSKASIHIRAGVGKMRNRPYRERRSILFVACKVDELRKGAGNLAGVEITTPGNLNAEILAPGGDAGRLSVFTEGALETMRKW